MSPFKRIVLDFNAPTVITPSIGVKPTKVVGHESREQTKQMFALGLEQRALKGTGKLGTTSPLTLPRDAKTP